MLVPLATWTDTCERGTTRCFSVVVVDEVVPEDVGVVVGVVEAGAALEVLVFGIPRSMKKVAATKTSSSRKTTGSDGW
jgi:hypothetical protein